MIGENIRLCSGTKAVIKFKSAGWAVVRQRGFHVMMAKADFEYTVSIPQHKELGPGPLLKLIRQVEIDVEEFNGL